MPKTHGTKALPLPHSIEDGLKSLGFIRIGDDSPAKFRMPRHPELALEVVASNLPGESAVIATGLGEGPRRLEPDALLVDATIAVMKADKGA